MPTRRHFLGIAGTALAHSSARAAQRPNILFVFADQLRSHELGCYGNSRIHTPNIDRLAGEGVRFQNAISTFPVCSPYRAMLLTGKYPMANGMTVNDHRLRPGVPSFARALKDAGYQTGYIGKWHIDGYGREKFTPRERRLGFDFWMALECTHDYFKSRYYDNDSDQPRYWEGYDAIAQTRAAQRYIRERSHAGPFALFMSWGPPHNPYIAPPEYMKRFDPAAMELRRNVADRAMDEWLMANAQTKLPPRSLPLRETMRRNWSDEGNIRKAYAGYYAATECLDDLIGDLRRTLAEERILNDTIVVFTADHGDMLASHGLSDKTVPFEEAISVPFIVRYPERIRAGATTAALLGPVDIMPTTLSLAGVRCPKVDGMDLSGQATARGGRARDAILLMQMTPAANSWIHSGTEPWRGVRTASHTYARFADGRPWFLYDNRSDPYQMTNLIAKPEHAALRDSLESRLRGLLQEAGDPCDTRVIDDDILNRNPESGFIKSVREANSEKL